MMLTADEVQGSDIAGPVVVILFLVGATIFGLGFAWAVMRRANADYKNTKAAVPKLRKGFWSAWWKAMKSAAVVGFIGMCLILYWIRSADREADAKPQPTPTPTSRVTR